jgi:hypothetical protein
MGNDLPRLRAYVPFTSVSFQQHPICSIALFLRLLISSPTFVDRILRLLLFRYNALKQGKVMEINDKCALASFAALLLSRCSIGLCIVCAASFAQVCVL